MTHSANNPLLEHNVFPPFSSILPEHIQPAIKQITEHNLKALELQLGEIKQPTWDNLVVPLEAREDVLSQAWSPVSHLNSVANSPALRQAYEACLELLSAYNTAMGQNEALYKAYTALAASDEFKGLSQPQKQAIGNAIRDFKLAGVALPTEQKKRFAQIQAELSQLSNKFSNNVLDATRGWFKHLKNQDQLSGLPEQAIAAAKLAAEAKELDGWVFSLDMPVYITVMTQADSASLREQMYTAFTTRASDQGPTAGQWQNCEPMQQILRLRQELAELLGFAHYSALSLAPKMADSCEQVLEFLQNLADKSKPAAQQEVKELEAWAFKSSGAKVLNAWDVAYYSEKLKQAKYQTSQEALRPFFPIDKVLSGMFALVQRLFDVRVRREQADNLWNPEVGLYCLERNNTPLAYFYLDAFAREGKRGGAWMGECRVRRSLGDAVQLPVAYLVCNFNAPVGHTPSLLTHSEVTTLFHEFGHGLHHMLTQVDVAAVSGINGVAWDAVELPSQFMENWCWEPEVINSLSGHYETGEALPADAVEKLLAAKNFQSAMMMLRQIELATFDLRLHMEFGGQGFSSVQGLLDDVRAEVAVLLPPAFNRFQNGFTHIFAGGYAAGYFSYKWAEVLSADVFAAFEEAGLFTAEIGKKFLTEVLEKGGSEEAMALFKNFRGRAPSIEALLRHSGVTDQAVRVANA